MMSARILSTLLLALSLAAAEPIISEGSKSLPLPGEAFKVNGRDAFVILPPDAKPDTPWVWYAPTLRGLPAKSEVWMFQQFLAKGIAIAGIDVGESYGSPNGRALYSALYAHLTSSRGFGPKPCLLARSRGGLMLYSWAVENPQSVGGVAGIYPVCNIASYPGLGRACGAYGMSEQELAAKLTTHNPIDRLEALAKAGVPLRHIHGDNDKVVPLDANSAILAERYRAFGGPAEVEVVPQQGHNMWHGWFQSQALTDFAIACALGQALRTPQPIAYWPLDGVGPLARDIAGGQHGKVVGAKTAKGRVGGALEFTRAQGNHVAIAYSENFALSTYTVAAWVYLTRPPTFSGVLGTRHGGDHTFDLKVNTDKVHGDIGTGTSWIETKVNFYAEDGGSNGEGGDLELERWYHLAYVIDAENGVCRLYLDADLKKTIKFTGKPLLMTPANSMHIGHSSGTEFMDGRIDELKIWDQALSADEVRAEWEAVP